MFLFSNHQGSDRFLAGECAQQNWTLLKQGCFNISSLAGQMDITYNNIIIIIIIFEESFVQIGDNSVYTYR